MATCTLPVFHDYNKCKNIIEISLMLTFFILGKVGLQQFPDFFFYIFYHISRLWDIHDNQKTNEIIQLVRTQWTYFHINQYWLILHCYNCLRLKFMIFSWWHDNFVLRREWRDFVRHDDYLLTIAAIAVI